MVRLQSENNLGFLNFRMGEEVWLPVSTIHWKIFTLTVPEGYDGSLEPSLPLPLKPLEHHSTAVLRDLREVP